jgi:hypothetical protein
VFEHHHRDEKIEKRIDHLMAGVFVVDDDERMESLAAHVAPDFVSVSPDAVFEGPQGLSDAFTRYRNERRWTCLRRTGLQRTSLRRTGRWTSITGISATAGSGSSEAPSHWRAGASVGWTRRGRSDGS